MVLTKQQGRCKLKLNFSHAELDFKYRCNEHEHDAVLPACQTTLKNLQLDYLDLYLVHWPIALERGADVWNLKDEQRLGYDPDREAKCWEV